MGTMPARGPDGELARDPVSELFDGAARKLLTRAYGNQGNWTETRLASPEVRHITWAAELGIDLLGPDPAATCSGQHIDARSAWARAFVRAVYYQHRWYYRAGHGLGAARRISPNRSLAIRYQVGRLMPVRGIIPAGRVVAIMALPGGQAARRAVERMPAGRRIFNPDGSHAGASADPEA